MRRFPNHSRFLVSVKVFIFIFFLFGGLNICDKLLFRISDESIQSIYQFYREPKYSLDTIFLGTSSMYCGVSPMYIYEQTGNKSFNLGTSSQSIRSTYYLLREVYKYQNPSMVMIDASVLYQNDEDEYATWYVLRGLRQSINKLQYEYDLYNASEVKRYEYFFPVLRFHDSWKTISQNDNSIKSFFTKGWLCTNFSVSGVTVEDMNYVERLLREDNVIFTLENGEYKQFIEEDSSEVKEVNIEYLEKIKKLCNENNSKLIVIKNPNVVLPNFIETAWTNEKYQKVKKICEKQGIEYIDLLYDVDIEIDPHIDSHDGGRHLNMLGAEKVSKYMCGLLDNTSNDLIESDEWNEQLCKYKSFIENSRIAMIFDYKLLYEQIKSVADNSLIIIAVQDDVGNGIDENDKMILGDLGGTIDLNGQELVAYILVVDRGKKVYEGLSNRKLYFNSEVEDGEVEYSVTSCGYLSGGATKIEINGTNYCCGGKGFNIVVYDEEYNVVLDSACINASENHTVTRNNWITYSENLKLRNMMMER